METCPDCDGDVLVLDKNGNEIQCPRCNGTGFVEVLPEFVSDEPVSSLDDEFVDED